MYGIADVFHGLHNPMAFREEPELDALAVRKNSASVRGGLSRDPSRTIERILEAARIEFGKNGFDGAKIEHIARRAKVSKQLVYLYFDGKQNLYGELVKSLSRASYERLLSVDFASLNPVAAVRTFIENVYDMFVEDTVMAVVTMDQSLHEGQHVKLPAEIQRMQEVLGERLAEMVQRGQKIGLFGNHVDGRGLEFMTTIIVSGCVTSRAMFERYTGQPKLEDPSFWRDYAVSFILRSLRP